MANKKYDIPESDAVMVEEPTSDYCITIPVTTDTSTVEQMLEESLQEKYV